MPIRVNLRELIGRWENNVGQGRRLSYRRLSELTDVHKDTLSRLARGEVKYLAISDIDALCRFFEVQVGDLLTYISEDETNRASQSPGSVHGRGVLDS